MNKKIVILSATAVLLAAVYVRFFTDWFAPKHIEISHTSRSNPGLRWGARVRAGNANTAVVQFGLDSNYRLTDVKVMSVSELKTNPAALPMWHLVSDSNSIPIKTFPYGVAIGGMKPAVGNEWPRPLDPSATYHIYITAGAKTGDHEFTTMPRSARDVDPTPPARPAPARPPIVRTNASPKAN